MQFSFNDASAIHNILHQTFRGTKSLFNSIRIFTPEIPSLYNTNDSTSEKIIVLTNNGEVQTEAVTQKYFSAASFGWIINL